jgi:hypothetical protein
VEDTNIDRITFFIVLELFLSKINNLSNEIHRIKKGFNFR